MLRKILRCFKAIYQPFISDNFQRRGKLGIFGGFLIHCVFGSVYIWGNLCEYVTSYLVNQEGQDLSNKTVGFIFPIILLMGPIGVVLGIFSVNKIGEKATLILFSFVLSCGVFLSSFSTNLYFFGVTYGVFYSISIGVMYMIPLDIAQQYFPNKKGTIYGSIICGYGLGSFMFNWILFFLINSDDKKPVPNNQNELLYPPDVSQNLPFALRILSCIYLVFAILGSLMVTKPSQRDLLEIRAGILSLQSLQLFRAEKEVQVIKPASQNQNDQRSSNQQQNTKNQEDVKETIITWQDAPPSVKEERKREKQILEESVQCPNLSTAFKQIELYLLAIIAFIGVSFGVVVAPNYKNYGLQFFKSDEYFYLISSLSSISNGFSRIFWGWLFDRLHFKSIIILNLSIQLFLVISFQFVASHSVFFALYVLLAFFCYGGWYSMVPAQLYRQFGPRFAKQIYSMVALSVPISSIFQQILIRHFTWDSIFLILFGIVSLGIIIVNVFPLTINWYEKLLLQNIFFQQNQAVSAATNVSQLQNSPEKNSGIASKVKGEKNYYMMNYEL